MEEIIDGEMDSIFLGILEGDQSIASNALLEDSFSSNIGAAPSSTSVRKKNPRSTTDRLKCPQCSNTYANERTLSNHKRMHAMKSASSRFPTKEEMFDMTKNALLSSLQEIQEEKCRSSTADSMCSLCVYVKEVTLSGDNNELIVLLVEYFTEILKKQNMLLPSALRSTVYRECNALLTNNNFRQKVKAVLLKILQVGPPVLNLFIGNVFLKVFEWQLVHFLRKLRGVSANGTQERPQYYSDDSHPEEYMQLVYYIGGFTINGILRKAKLYHSNTNWVAFGNIVKVKLLKQSLEPDNCPAHITCFTVDKNRGGLKFLCLEAFGFFMSLFKLIMSSEEADGSLPFDKVEKKVFTDDILVFTFDDLVGCELTEEQFSELLCIIIHCCCKVVSKGIIRRRLNNELVKAYTSVGFRPRLAR